MLFFLCSFYLFIYFYLFFFVVFSLAQDLILLNYSGLLYYYGHFLKIYIELNKQI
ncbi:hypothetical protein C2G38_352002 [Gigaspora rosea]|uniref:Uncharacterized protein n=1 Tax=Gigaspora rosea TaxID=44941 RepID=A0A397UI07_9GLOM|nr:hypothetical protein C2G38_352002 [Gigaspora rosea]